MDNMEASDITTPAAPYAAPPPAQYHGTDVFKGRFGLRAVWGIGLFLVLVVSLSFVFNVATRIAEGKSAFPKRPDVKQGSAANQSAVAKPSSTDVTAPPTIVGDGAGFVAVALACLLMARIERRTFGVFGIGKNRFGDFLPGAFWGVALLSALVALLRGLHVLVFDGRALHGSAVYLSGATWLLAFFTVGLMEEYLTRGYIQFTLTRGFFTLAERISPRRARAIAYWSAAVIMSLVFGAGHLTNPGETAPGIAAAFLAGLVFTYALWRTGSLWWAIGFHMAWDWAQSFLYGVPDSGFLSAGRLFNTHPAGNPLLSGGRTGPEASIFVLPTLLLVLVVIRFTTPAGAQPPLGPLRATQSHAQEQNAGIA